MSVKLGILPSLRQDFTNLATTNFSKKYHETGVVLTVFQILHNFKTQL